MKRFKISLLDLLAGITLLAAIAIVIAFSTIRPPEVTELYFDNHTALPVFNSGLARFTFAIHNMEGRSMNYEALVSYAYEEGNESRSVNVTTISELVRNMETASLNVEVPLREGVERARINVGLLSKNQNIGFWTEHSERPLYYEGTGVGSADCILNHTAMISDSEGAGQITSVFIKARGEPALDEWPRMRLWVDGRVVGSAIVASENYSLYEFPLAGLEEGLHVIDVEFTNDYSYRASGYSEDRNLFIEGIVIGSAWIEPGITEFGRGRDAFDCRNAIEGMQLYSNGVMRFALRKP
ncbi:hypothetical protein COT48_05845 [Candidatus Woesearchaeota archaeon CG08_land_8_20_14_0_20_47_9]|nr:MAG: hypothetical protein AUJ69_02175 [Candidatus Woesearchaeota archaeon CG1_02_47_18]PIN71969.1 MAG: hypothetical protein COV22_04395 [Candidatus Woesearchaeota archaeon CG10_big_fil_rev_8_21_14_0_10_47_5]PIO03179.1 MAG: hypothetical protein COT48_05845 [Candidatus Woesearchaeota archaeon CG08_land_8_20_14_0_20_47_9]HII29848.1 hypothetical protein [Candidatus Woesearchaeota archaeon]